MAYIDKVNFEIYHDIGDTRIRGPLFEVDDMIAYPISLLNKKGYRTKACCCGHPRDVRMHDIIWVNEFYVWFDADYTFDIPIPKEFRIDNEEDGSISIRYFIEGETYAEGLQSVNDIIEIFTKWVQSLPEFKRSSDLILDVEDIVTRQLNIERDKKGYVSVNDMYRVFENLVVSGHGDKKFLCCGANSAYLYMNKDVVSIDHEYLDEDYLMEDYPNPGCE